MDYFDPFNTFMAGLLFLAALIVCGPLQFNSHSLMYFRAVALSDPIRCVLKHGTGHAVKCLNV